jgi:hypothetical protein
MIKAICIVGIIWAGLVFIGGMLQIGEWLPKTDKEDLL